MGAPVTIKRRITAPRNSMEKEVVIQFNNLLKTLTGSYVTNPTVLSLGSTDTQVGTTAVNFTINGVPALKAAAAAGVAFTTAFTCAADQWCIMEASVVAAGTVTWTNGAGNTAGYATEALAIAALPATPANAADLGYVTVKTKAATAWIAATDSLAAGASGNIASQTNYYSTAALFSGIADLRATLITAQ